MGRHRKPLPLAKRVRDLAPFFESAQAGRRLQQKRVQP